MWKKPLFISCSFEIKNRLKSTYIGAAEVFDRKQGQPMKFSLNWVLSEFTGLGRYFLERTIGKWKSTGMMKATQYTCKLHFQCYLSFLSYPVFILALSNTLCYYNRQKFKRCSFFLIMHFACYAMAFVDFYFASYLMCRSEYYCCTLLQGKNTVISSTHTAVDTWQAEVQQWPSIWSTSLASNTCHKINSL